MVYTPAARPLLPKPAPVVARVTPVLLPKPATSPSKQAAPPSAVPSTPPRAKELRLASPAGIDELLDIDDGVPAFFSIETAATAAFREAGRHARRRARRLSPYAKSPDRKMAQLEADLWSEAEIQLGTFFTDMNAKIEAAMEELMPKSDDDEEELDLEEKPAAPYQDEDEDDYDEELDLACANAAAEDAAMAAANATVEDLTEDQKYAMWAACWGELDESDSEDIAVLAEL